MKNYIIWHSEYENELLVEILNKCDVSSVQKEFLEMGYIIMRVAGAFDKIFMKVVKEDEQH